jgi:aminoglycoside phosphotransferase (APT) family kinase protein
MSDPNTAPPPDRTALEEGLARTSRDPGALRDRLETWLVGRLPDADRVRVGEVTSPASNGMSSETLLFDASWHDAGGEHRADLVARVEPDTVDTPVFPVYDLASQFRIISLVGDRTSVPVPTMRWLETDPGPLGATFFVMDRVNGRVPPDIPPYTMDGWVLTATEDERATLERSTVEALAELHTLNPTNADVAFLEFDAPGGTHLRRHVEAQRRYYEWVRNGRTHPIIDEAFSWLEDHWPADEGDTVVSWGDSRIGNIMYDGFTPAAVLDWEMAGLAPRGLDVGWMIFLHVFFQEITEQLELPGLPGFMHRDRVRSTYEAAAGAPLTNLEFFEVYAALRHAVVMTRVHERTVRFGQAVWPEDPDEVIYHRPALRRMLDGTYWD